MKIVFANGLTPCGAFGSEHFSPSIGGSFLDMGRYVSNRFYLRRSALQKAPWFLFIIIILASCQGPFLPNMGEMLGPGEEAVLLGADFGLEIAKEYRDDNQNLIVLVAAGNLPLNQRELPSFQLSRGARIFPLTPAYILQFLQMNPHVNINSQGFMFSNDKGRLFVQELTQIIENGQTVVIPPLQEVVISSGQLSSYDYVVISGSGNEVNQYRIVLAGADESSTDILTATIPLYRNTGMITSTLYPVIDHTSSVISGIRPSDSPPVLSPYFIIPPGATMQVAGAAYNPENGSAIDFSRDVSIRVTSKNGYFSQDYTMRLVPGTSGCTLYSVDFYTEDNPLLGQNINPVFQADGATLIAEYPFGTDVSSLIGWANISGGATITIGGTPFTSGETVLDLTNAVVLTVTAGDVSNSRDYTIRLAENRSACELLDIQISREINPDLLSDPHISFSRNAHRIVIYVEGQWDTLSYNYTVSAGAHLENAHSDTRGIITAENATMRVIAPDAAFSTEYTVTVVTSGIVDIPNPIFVSPNGTGSGVDWNNPASLHNALNMAAQSINPVEIRLQQGTYSPGSLQTDCFSVPLYTGILGGYSGNPNNPEERDATIYPSYISGDIYGDDSIEQLERNTFENNNNHLMQIAGDTVTIDGISFLHSYQSALSIEGINIRVTNCTFDFNYNSCIIVENSEHLTIENSLFSNTLGDARRQRNGSVTVSNSRSILLINNRFENNMCFSGSSAGVSFSGCYGAAVEYCTFNNNWSFYGGGAVSTGNSRNIIINNCIFTQNISGSIGGGALRLGSGTSSVRISNCMFRENTAHGRGGAVLCTNADYIRFINTEFLANTVERDGYYHLGEYCKESGGAILFIDTINIFFETVDFTNNVSTVLDYGSNRYFGHQIAFHFQDNPVTLHDFSGCTFSNNSALSNDQIGYWQGYGYNAVWTTVR